jgi:hypothetical protein
MTLLTELSVNPSPRKAPAHYVRSLGAKRVVITNDAGRWALMSEKEYSAFVEGKALPSALAEELSRQGFRRPPDIAAAAEDIFPRSLLSWRGPARHIVVLEQDGVRMPDETALAAIDFAFSCGPDAPALELVAEDPRALWPSVWLCARWAQRRGEWARRPARVTLRSPAPERADARALDGLDLSLRAELLADGPPPSGAVPPARSALVRVAAGARDPEGWVRRLREGALESVRFAAASPADEEAFGAFYARALAALIDGAGRSDLADENLTARLGRSPWELPGLEILGELAYGPGGGIHGSERALQEGEQPLASLGTARWQELGASAAARRRLAAADPDARPACAHCAYKPFCREQPAGPACASTRCSLDAFFRQGSNENALILLQKSRVDRV